MAKGKSSGEKYTLELIRVVRETANAILVEDTAGQELWLPLSTVHQIHRDDIPPTIVVDLWIARNKGLL